MRRRVDLLLWLATVEAHLTEAVSSRLRNGRPAPRLKTTLLSLVCWVVGCDFSRGGQFCARCGRFLP